MEQIIFNARCIYSFKVDKLFRAYVIGKKIHFLRMKQKLNSIDLVAELFNTLFFGLGLGFKEIFKKKLEKKLKILSDQTDERFSNKEYQKDKHEFEISIDDIESGTLQAVKDEDHYESVKGKLRLIMKDESKHKLNFEHMEDMHIAMEYFPKTLGDKLIVNAVWNEKKKRYKKIKKVKESKKKSFSQ